MSTGGRRDLQFTPEFYWQMRERELNRKLLLVKDAIDECTDARVLLSNLSDTAKLNSPEWEQAQGKAMASLRKARGARTQLRKMVANMRDTIRIRPHLAGAVTDHVVAQMDTASRLCDYLDAHGY